MKRKPVLTSGLAAALALAFGVAHAQDGVQWRFSGFGTLGVVHSDNRDADFTASAAQPNGPGYTRRTSFDPDTKLAAQLEATFTPQWSAVLQLVSQHHFDNGYEPEVEWANVKYQVTPELSVRVGRTPAPFMLLSDTRMVGYAQTWVRPPVEVYGTLRSRNDGVEAIWRRRFGSVENTLQAYAGRSTDKQPNGGEVKLKSQWGISDAVQTGDLTLRAGYGGGKLDFHIPGVDAMLAGLAAFETAPAPIGPMATALAAKFDQYGQSVRTYTLGASYDPGSWFTTAEFLSMDSDREGTLASPTKAWYLTGGYRFGAFTPYATYTRQRNHTFVEPGLPIPAAAGLNAG